MQEPEYSRGAHARSRIYKRTLRLHELGYADYAAYIRSPAWKDVKRRYRASNLPQDCVICGTDERLVMHHKTYDRVGEEWISDLMPLCVDCHQMLHDLEREGHVGLEHSGVFDVERAIEGRAYLDGLAASRAAEADERRAELDALPIAERIARALRAAKVSGVDLRFARARLRRQIKCRRSNQIPASLRALENKAYGWHKPRPGNEVMPDHPEPRA